MNYSTDKEVIEDLEILSQIINESIEQATKILDEAKEINQIRTLIEEIKTSRESLELTRHEVIEIEDRLDPLKTLPEELQKLGIDNNLLKNIQETIIIAEKNKEAILESEKKVIKLNEKTHSLSTKIQNDTENIQEIFIVYDQKTANAKIIFNELESTLIKIETIEKRLKPLKTLPEELQKLGIDDNLLKNIQETIIIAEKNKEAILESEKKVIKLNEKTHSLSTKIHDDIQEIKKLLILYDEKADNAKIIINELKSMLIEIETIEKRLESLKTLPEQLQKLGIDNNFLKNIQEMLIVVEKNKEDICESEKKIVYLNKLNHKLSKKIDNDIQELKKCEEKTIKAKMVLNDLKSVLAETGTLDEIKLMLNELKVARSQLESSRQELIAVRKFEAYLQEFQVNSSSKQFKKWLWKELGFVGILIYFLRFIIPKSRKNN